MKKLLIVLLLVLLARVPAAEWNKIPDQTEFLRLLGAVFSEKFECNKAIIGTMEVGEDVLFFGDCIQKEKEVIL